MHIKSVASALAIALLSTTAMAADLPSRRAPPVYVPPPLPVFTWTGFYVGGQVGYEFGKSSAFSTFVPTGAANGFASASRNGVIGGAHVGYLFSTQSLPVLGGVFGAVGTGGVIGVEGDVDGSTARGTAFLPGVGVGGIAASSSDRIQGSIRGRLGITYDRALFYATGGAAFGDLRNSYVNAASGAFDSIERTRVGYTVGGGVEYAFTNNLSARVEYRYTDYGRMNDVLVNSTAATTVVSHREYNNRVQVGFSYKLDALTAPVVARY